MPLTINVGLTQKIGQPNYSSLGASCHVEFEADAALLERDIENFHERVRAAYAACWQAVEEELGLRGANPDAPAAERHLAQPSNGNGHSQRPHDEGTATIATTEREVARAKNGHTATGRQLSYARQLAAQIDGLGLRRLEQLVVHLFGKPLAALDSAEASKLIDTLRDAWAGRFDVRDALEEEPA